MSKTVAEPLFEEGCQAAGTRAGNVLSVHLYVDFISWLLRAAAVALIWGLAALQNGVGRLLGLSISTEAPARLSRLPS